VSEPNEHQLITRARRGEPAAWDELFDRHYAPTGRFLWQIAPDLSREDIEEVCQEVFLKVVQRLNQFHGDSQLQTWIFRIAANAARDLRDKQQTAKRGNGISPLSLHADNAENGLAVDPPSAMPGPDALMMNGERIRQLREALDALGEPCREVVELRYFGELSYEELADTLKLNAKTVSSRLSKCLDQLESIATEIFSREKRRSFPSNPA
jgi:RNA polymerase sigma-70 factor (ECF subfamily)